MPLPQPFRIPRAQTDRGPELCQLRRTWPTDTYYSLLPSVQCLATVNIEFFGAIYEGVPRIRDWGGERSFKRAKSSSRGEEEEADVFSWYFWSSSRPTLSFRLWMEVEGKEEEEGKENYFGANWNAWRDWLEWNTYALTRDSRFGFLRRAEWMSLTMLTRGCFSFFRGGGRRRDGETVDTVRCSKKIEQDLSERDSLAMCRMTELNTIELNRNMCIRAITSNPIVLSFVYISDSTRFAITVNSFESTNVTNEHLSIRRTVGKILRMYLGAYHSRKFVITVNSFKKNRKREIAVCPSPSLPSNEKLSIRRTIRT